MVTSRWPPMTQLLVLLNATADAIINVMDSTSSSNVTHLSLQEMVVTILLVSPESSVLTGVNSSRRILPPTLEACGINSKVSMLDLTVIT